MVPTFSDWQLFDRLLQCLLHFTRKKLSNIVGLLPATERKMISHYSSSSGNHTRCMLKMLQKTLSGTGRWSWTIAHSISNSCTGINFQTFRCLMQPRICNIIPVQYLTLCCTKDQTMNLKLKWYGFLCTIYTHVSHASSNAQMLHFTITY